MTAPISPFDQFAAPAPSPYEEWQVANAGNASANDLMKRIGNQEASAYSEGLNSSDPFVRQTAQAYTAGFGSKGLPDGFDFAKWQQEGQPSGFDAKLNGTPVDPSLKNIGGQIMRANAAGVYEPVNAPQPTAGPQLETPHSRDLSSFSGGAMPSDSLPLSQTPPSAPDPFAQFTIPKAFGLPTQGIATPPTDGLDGVTTNGGAIINDPFGGSTAGQEIGDAGGQKIGVIGADGLPQPSGGGGVQSAFISPSDINGGMAAASPMGGGMPSGIRPLRRPSNLQNGRAPTGNFGGNGIRPLRRPNPTIGGAPQAPATGPGSAGASGIASY